MATTTRSASDDVLKEALEEIREMNKFIPQTLKDSKCKLCFQDGCDCENKLHQIYTCLNGHLHQNCERPKGMKLGDVAVQAPCPLYSQQKTLYGNMEPGHEFVDEKLSNLVEADRTMKRRMRKGWIATVGFITIGLLISLAVFAVLIKRSESIEPEDSQLTPPLVGPNGPATAQSVYRDGDGNLLVCGFSTGEYSCETIKPDSEGSSE